MQLMIILYQFAGSSAMVKNTCLIFVKLSQLCSCFHGTPAGAVGAGSFEHVMRLGTCLRRPVEYTKLRGKRLFFAFVLAVVKLQVISFIMLHCDAVYLPEGRKFTVTSNGEKQFV
mgnify:FL=1